MVINTGGGGMEQVIDGADTIRDRGPGQVSPFAIPALSGSMAAAQVSMKYGLTGPVITQVAACASGVIAFQDALRLISSGECDVVLAGGSEAPLLPMAFAALGNMGALSKRNDDPQGASRPFDRTRDGFVFGEGAGILVVESAEHALARGATILAEIVGAALTADAFHISAPEPTGRGATMAMTKALAPGRPRPERGRLHRRPRHVDAAQRRHRDAGDQGGLRRARLQAPDLVAQVDGRAHARRRRRAVGDRRRRRDPRRLDPADDQLPRAGSGLRPRLRAEREAPGRRSTTAMINGFGFGGQNAVAIFRRFEP